MLVSSLYSSSSCFCFFLFFILALLFRTSELFLFSFLLITFVGLYLCLRFFLALLTRRVYFLFHGLIHERKM